MKKFLIIGGVIAAILIVLYMMNTKQGTLPSGNVASAPSSVNASGFQYGNLT